MSSHAATLLCLFCRGKGHRAASCPSERFIAQKNNDPYNNDVGFEDPYYWCYSQQRARFMAEYVDGTPNEICQRCEGLDLANWIKEVPTLRFVHDFKRDDVKDSSDYKNLGHVGSISIWDNCSVCRCLFCMIPTPYKKNGEVEAFLALTWLAFRVQQRVDFTLGDQHAGQRAITAFVLPSDYPQFLHGWKIFSSKGVPLCLVDPSEDGTGTGLSGREIDQSRVDWNIVRTWLNACVRSHPTTCGPRNTWKPEILARIRLIDVAERRIVPYSTESRDYLTLSYVWGGVECKSFDRSKKLGQLPNVIEDAILAVRKLGKRYLWADMVCIDQQDNRDKMAQIEVMGSIYQYAFAAIVALSAMTADHGLPRAADRSDGFPQLNCQIGDAKLVGIGPSLAGISVTTRWRHRGWTFQEAALSPRCIFFDSHQVYFECNVMQCQETINEGGTRLEMAHDADASRKTHANSSRNRYALHSNPLLKLNKRNRYLEYHSLAVGLANRQFTLRTDTLSAFKGMLQAFQETVYPEGFIWALPVADLDLALLWEPLTFAPQNKEVFRRAVTDSSYEKWQPNDFFPSWTWLSMKASLASHEGTSYDKSADDVSPVISVTVRKGDSLRTIFGRQTTIESKLWELWPPQVSPFLDHSAAEHLQRLPIDQAERMLCIEAEVLDLSHFLPLGSETKYLDHRSGRNFVCVELEQGRVTFIASQLRPLFSPKGLDLTCVKVRQSETPDLVYYFCLLLEHHNETFVRHSALRIGHRVSEPELSRYFSPIRRTLILR